MRKHLIISIIISLIYTSTYCQKNNSLFYFGGIYVNTGKIVPHSNRVKHLTGEIYSFQAKIYHRIEDIAPENFPFHSTRFGYSLSYIQTSNNSIGSIWGLNMFLEPRIYHFKKLILTSHLGGGLAYASQKFNKENNPTNYMISTDLSFFFNAKFQLDYQINNQLSCGLNAGFAHCSNGALNLPNLGINILNYGFNIEYQIYDHNYINKKSLKTKLGNKWANDFSLGFAVRNVNEELDKYYRIYTADYAINRFLNKKNILSLNLHYVLRQGEINDTYYSTTYNSYIGLALGHELLIRKLSVLTQLGNYFYDTNLNKHYWYARLGIRYYFNSKLFGTITLTNRKQSADYIQYAIGFRL